MNRVVYFKEDLEYLSPHILPSIRVMFTHLKYKCRFIHQH